MEDEYNDYCRECIRYGNNYCFDWNGDIVRACDYCPVNDLRDRDDE